ncbi:hypothetical protein [Pedobacter aquatilis]|uniref:hypothetical protein n=1 Tax=Pedobacter aquatilis TaxID=351343 RepID=UPI00292CD303|nr:hypothetical protein [Pedobacter aquatilis]
MLSLLPIIAKAQRVVFDRDHFNIVNENGAVRLGSELTHNSLLNTINSRLSDIQLNLSAVVLVQDIIFRSLSEVDDGLKSAIAVQQIGGLCIEITASTAKVVELAKSNPALLLFAESVAADAKRRGYDLLLEVSTLVLKEGDNLLMDFEKRDALLKKISLELKVIRALVFSMEKSMYWARLKGIFRSLNPYQNFINRDEQLINNIINQYHLLNPKK